MRLASAKHQPLAIIAARIAKVRLGIPTRSVSADIESVGSLDTTCSEANRFLIQARLVR